MNINSNQQIFIELTPSLRMFWIENSGLMAVYLMMLLLSGYENHNVALCSMVIAFVITVIILYKFWYLSKLKWIVTDKQLIRECGVFTRDIQYIELYRVVDYCEKQSFMQMALGLKDIIVFSGDRTTPAERIIGVPASLDIIAQLKELVEQQKKEYHVYEITNR